MQREFFPGKHKIEETTFGMDYFMLPGKNSCLIPTTAFPTQKNKNKNIGKKLKKQPYTALKPQMEQNCAHLQHFLHTPEGASFNFAFVRY